MSRGWASGQAVATYEVYQVDDLRVLASEFPDAPKYWVGDWMIEGESRFGVTADEASDVLGRGLSAVRWPSWPLFPSGVAADSISLVFPEALSREEWERIGVALGALADDG